MAQIGAVAPKGIINVLSRVWVTYRTGFGLVIGFIDHSLYSAFGESLCT
jgi:hypothetical protein